MTTRPTWSGRAPTTRRASPRLDWYEPRPDHPPGPSLVLHVLPTDLVRGAQVFARALCDRLDRPEQRHQTLSVFAGSPGALTPGHALDSPAGRLRRIGYDPWAVRRLRSALRGLNPDVVVAHGGEPLKYCVPAVPQGTRLVYYKIGSSEAFVKRRLHASWHGRLMRAADKVVAISDDMAHEVVTLFGVQPDQLVVIPNGRDPAQYQPARNHGMPVRLLFVGNLDEGKRPLWFVEVVRRLWDLGLPVAGSMVGDGPLLDEVRAAAAGLPLAVLGRREAYEVPGLLASSHILVFPSGPGEGMPGVYLEAGFSALPVVTTAVAGTTAVIEHGVTGFVVPPDDIDSLVERTVDLVTDPGRRWVMGQAARARCLERFSLDAVATSWTKLLTHDR